MECQRYVSIIKSYNKLKITHTQIANETVHICRTLVVKRDDQSFTSDLHMNIFMLYIDLKMVQYIITINI